MPSIDHSSRPGTRPAHRVSLTAARLALVPCLLVVFSLAAAPSAAQEPEARGKASEERRKQMEERRNKRAEVASEMRERRNDPDFLKENAWWNNEDNIEAFSLTGAQRKIADQALMTFLAQREEATTGAREAQTAFFEALAAGAADLQAKKDQMISAMTAMSAANADLRITVIGALTSDQRSKLGSENPRLLRSNWTDPRSGRSSRQLQRRRGSQPNG